MTSRWLPMLRATLKSLLARKLRLTLSALAVVLGVAFVAGAFVLTDTLGRTFDRPVLVGQQEHRRRRPRRRGHRGSSNSDAAGRRDVPAAHVATVSASTASPRCRAVVDAQVTVSVARQGRQGVATSGAPMHRRQLDRRRPSLNQQRVVAGARRADPTRSCRRQGWPTRPASRSATPITSSRRPGSSELQVVGLVQYDGKRQPRRRAVRRASRPRPRRSCCTSDGYSDVVVAASDGVSERRSCATGSRPRCAGGLEAITGTQLADEQASDDPAGLGVPQHVPARSSPRWRCSSGRSSSSTRSRSWSPSAPGSWPCCGRSAPPRAR